MSGTSDHWGHMYTLVVESEAVQVGICKMTHNRLVCICGPSLDAFQSLNIFEVSGAVKDLSSDNRYA